MRHAKPGGWAFERANVHYPDIDDTAVVLIVLARLRSHYRDRERLEHAIAGRARLDARDAELATAAGRRSTRTTTRRCSRSCPSATSARRSTRRAPDVTAHVHRGARMARLTARRGRRRGARVPATRAGARRELVRPLGRELHLRYGRRAACARSASARTCARDTCGAPRDWIVEHQNADGGWGETCASLHGRQPARARARARRRRRRGR